METAVPTYVTTDRKMAPGANTSPGLRSWSVVTMVTLYSLYTHILHTLFTSLAQKNMVGIFSMRKGCISRVLQPTTHVLWV